MYFAGRIPLRSYLAGLAWQGAAYAVIRAAVILAFADRPGAAILRAAFLDFLPPLLILLSLWKQHPAHDKSDDRGDNAEHDREQPAPPEFTPAPRRI